METFAEVGKHLRTPKQSETLLINQLSLERTARNEDVYKFGFGQSPFPVPVNISQSLSESAYRKEYMNVQGYVPLRQAIAKFHGEKEGTKWSSDNIIIGTGSKILLFCLMASFKRAQVLLPSPSWVSYQPQAELAGHKTFWLPATFDNRWKVTAKQVEEFCIGRRDSTVPLLLVLNYPSNPSGQTYTKAELAELAIVVRKHNVIVISDEIYSFISFDDNHCSMAEFYPEGTVVSSGLSKWCGAGGWRIGFMHVPDELTHLLNTMIGVASETYSCASSPIQIAATKAYQDIESANSLLGKQIEILSTISSYCSERLRAVGVNVHNAQGGFYLFPDFTRFRNKLETHGIHTSEQLTNAIMATTGVALLPGSAFGMTPDSLTARLAFVDFDGRKAISSSSQDLDFERVKTGITKLCAWLSSL